MAMPFEVFTDHYALQWLKTMRTGSALLHRWSATLEEYDFTVHHRPGKVQSHVDGLSRLPWGPSPPEDTLLHIQVNSEEEAHKLVQELHSATHLGGQALWKLFSDRYSHKAGRRLCIEVAQSCPQCQLGSDYGHRLKTAGSIQSRGPWDTLSVDIVGPLPTDRRHEFLIVFVDCYSRYAILVPASNHTASTVSDALLHHVVPYFGTPHRLLSDRGRKFVGEVWGKLTRSLGIQRLLTSPYHPEGNSINERSHRTINNMLRARLLDGTPSRTWVDKIPGIMLALNAMAHEPHGFSASMIATGREPTLPPDLESNACASPSIDDPAAYVDALKQRLSLTHQQMAPPPAPAATNPYCEGSLIFVLTTPPERTNKLAPRWKVPFVVKRVPNPAEQLAKKNCEELFKNEHWNCSGFSLLNPPNITTRGRFTAILKVVLTVQTCMRLLHVWVVVSAIAKLFIPYHLNPWVPVLPNPSTDSDGKSRILSAKLGFRWKE